MFVESHVYSLAVRYTSTERLDLLAVDKEKPTFLECVSVLVYLSAKAASRMGVNSVVTVATIASVSNFTF